MKPQLLALRTVNQYRTRDILAYLGLRYYFANQCACRDRWASDVASHLVLTRSNTPYFQSQHFKDIRADGQIDHRQIFLPGPNESFAEAVLLAECAKHPAFHTPEFVFSYKLAEGDESQGVYTPYFLGLQERHRKIADACRNNPGSVVRYTDIKRFYPSISAKLAEAAWQKASDQAQLATHYRELGLKLLDDHAATATNRKHGNGLLTGPMFSHLIANLVLRNVDKVMSDLFPGRYFRYVDDVVLVGVPEQNENGRALLHSLLSDLGLELHDQGAGKDFDVGGNDWLAGEKDFEGSNSRGWMIFARDLKQLLISRVSSRSSLAPMFAAEGFRIPLPDYCVEVSDARYQKHFFELLGKYPWLLKKIFRQSTPSSLLLTAKFLRSDYTEHLNRIFETGSDINGYDRKRAIPKIRYLAGRLLYLGRTEDLTTIAGRLKAYPELSMLAEILNAVATRNVTNLLPLGSNAVQSAAQILKLSADAIECNVDSWNVAERQGLAVLRANGVTVHGPDDDELNRFALWQGGKNGHDLMESQDAFIQELACLHGVADAPRHQATLETAFDRGEELAFDATTPIDTY